jgi:hypothetical protein
MLIVSPGYQFTLRAILPDAVGQPSKRRVGDIDGRIAAKPN